jgi:hypothetical protein
VPSFTVFAFIGSEEVEATVGFFIHEENMFQGFFFGDILFFVFAFPFERFH